MTLALWRPALARALHRNRARAYSRYLQLATIDTEGKPSNRTLVFRGFVGEALQMVTDSRSQKVIQIQACPWAEVCWYFTVTREQFRIAGKLALIRSNNDSDSMRSKTWKAMSANARQQFYWPHPGHGRANKTAFELSGTPTDHPPDSFSLLLLQANRVDHLCLRGDPQKRHIYERHEDQWSVEDVNP